MQNIKRFKRSVTVLLLSVGMMLFPAVGMASAADTTTAPSMTIHYVYNCTNPTVEVDFFNVSGTYDVYAHDDYGYVLIAQNKTFDGSTIYDGYWNPKGNVQEDVFLTEPGAGPYAEQVLSKSTSATAKCPVYYPKYRANNVKPTPPAGSVTIEFSYLEWYRDN